MVMQLVIAHLREIIKESVVYVYETYMLRKLELVLMCFSVESPNLISSRIGIIIPLLL